MMTYSKSERLLRLQDAVDTGHLYDYMTGQAGYSYVSNYADAPTETQDVFASILDYVKNDEFNPLWENFEMTWITISKNKEYSWLAVYYLFGYLKYYSTKSGSIPQHATDTINQVLGNISKHKTTLSKDKRWVGRMYEDGLWQDVVRVVNNVNERFNLQMAI
ncbi:MAG: hypothetical protein M3Y54_20165 [Bacteroidota bacterium]|nr:hypothetical protein [Bacteroidota bacterium]